MKKQFILLCFVIYYFSAYSQMSKSYFYLLSDKDVNKRTCDVNEIFFYGVDVDLEEQRYLITIGLYPDSDSHFIKLISYGKCTLKGDILIMYDHIHDIQMSARLGSDTFSFIRCFPFLKDKHFLSIGFDDTFDYHIETKWNFPIVREQETNFVCSLDNLFLDGYYKTMGDDYRIYLEGDNYKLFYKGLLLSDGKMAKGGINEIIFIDMSLSTTFSIWLDGTSLKSQCVPGCYKVVTFEKVK